MHWAGSRATKASYMTTSASYMTTDASCVASFINGASWIGNGPWQVSLPYRRAKTLYDCKAEDDLELSFKKGEILTDGKFTKSTS